MIETAPSADQPEYTCPNCGHSLGNVEPHQSVVSCPNCGQGVTLAAEDVSPPAAREIQSAQGIEVPADDELSGLKIRQISDLRRGAVRTRSWLLIGAIVCAVGAIQLIFLAVSGYRSGLRLAPLGDLAASVLAVILCIYFSNRAVAAHREIKHSHLEEPLTPPDFSTLSDGSQHSANLERMAEQTFEE